MITKTRIITLISLLLAAGCAQFGGGPSSKLASTHHSSIIIEWINDAGRTPEKTAADFNNITMIVNEWANQAGFYLLTPDHPEQIRQGFTPVKSDGKAEAIYFHERNPQKAGWPIEVMIAYDPNDNPPRVQIAMAEGYGKVPSERLQSAHTALSERLAKRYGKNVEALIW